VIWVPRLANTSDATVQLDLFFKKLIFCFLGVQLLVEINLAVESHTSQVVTLVTVQVEL
jgi:hypothetical protein